MAITLKAARVNKNLSQVNAAKALGISVDTLGKYERGQLFPGVPTIQKMEMLYGVSYNDLIFFAPKLRFNRTKGRMMFYD